MRLASTGLTAQEQELLHQQLKLLAGRLSAPWIYVGESLDADLLLMRNTRLDAPTYRGLAAYPGAAVSRRGDLPLEWPLRMVALRELLLEAEKRLMVKSSGPVCAEQLAELKMAGWLRLNDRQIHIHPRQDRIEADVADREELLLLLGQPELDIQSQLGLEMPAGELGYVDSLRAVVWSLALRSGAHCGRNWNPEKLRFSLSAWPHFDEWEVGPPLLRLAALYTRKPATIMQGAQMSGLGMDEVTGFLLACELCHIGVVKEYIETQSEVVKPVAQPGSGGMLQRLRERLGLGFGRKS